jgi:GNAT superfamily N-acetyltransferase
VSAPDDWADPRGGYPQASPRKTAGGVRVRAADLLNLGDVADIARLRGQWSEYLGYGADPTYEERVADFLARHRDVRRIWLADVAPMSGFAPIGGGRQAVGMTSLEVFERLPHRGRPTARWGYVANVWTDPSYRRLGIARALMAALLAWSREERLVRLVLNPSEISKDLYAGLGFRPADDLMRLDLR